MSATPYKCPLCQADLTGDEIKHDALFHGLTPRHYSRAIGIEQQGLYDGVVMWRCPECRGTWERAR